MMSHQIGLKIIRFEFSKLVS